MGALSETQLNVQELASRHGHTRGRWQIRCALLLGITLLLVLGGLTGVAQASQVTNVSVTDSPPSAAVGARTSYTVAFVTSATGGLVGASNSKITITFPSGTDLTTLVSSSVTDATTNQQV